MPHLDHPGDLPPGEGVRVPHRDSLRWQVNRQGWDKPGETVSGSRMIEQWEADALLRARKVYSRDLIVDLGRGADEDYPVETADGHEFFLLDVCGPGRNPGKARFQLRYRRSIVLARMCLVAPHKNPDGIRIESPHYHTYREPYDDKFASEVGKFDCIDDALLDFCTRVNLPAPTIQGGLR